MAQDLPGSDETLPAQAANGRPRIGLVAGLTAGLGLVALGGLVASDRLPLLSEKFAAWTAPAPQEPTQEVAAPAETPAVDTEQQAQAENAPPAAEEPVLGQDQGHEAESPERFKSALIEPPASDVPASTEAAPAVEASPAETQLQSVPLPMPRPAELRGRTVRRALRPAPRRTVAAPPPAPVEDTRSFFDKLFGVAPPSTPPSTALAYASLESTGSLRQPAPLPRAVPAPVAPAPVPVPQAGGGTAVYDITARTVTLPSGEKLEAHSGLGSAMDDPRFVHLRMRGPTPPGTYDLSEREERFHGVRAIRMTPVGGSAAIHGRDGILAHTYMLGASGASNGCVAFRDYEKFLQAHLSGQVTRLVVVAGTPQDALPSLVKRIFGSERTRVGSAE